MKKIFLPLFSFLFVLYFLIILPAPALAFANLINYQGRAFNSQNKFLPDGCYDVRFEIGIYSSAIVSPTQNLNGASIAPTVLPASRTYDTHPTQTCPSGRFYIQNGLFNALLDVSYVTNTFANYQNWGVRAAFYPTKDTTPPSTWPASTDWSVPQPLAAAPMAYTSKSLYGNSTASNIIGDARATGAIYSQNYWKTTAIYAKSGSSGISMIQDWPFIGFNTYYDGPVNPADKKPTDPPDTWRSINKGAASKGAGIGVNPSNSDIEFYRIYPIDGNKNEISEATAYNAEMSAEKVASISVSNKNSFPGRLFSLIGGNNNASYLDLWSGGPGAGWYSVIQARSTAVGNVAASSRNLKLNPDGGNVESAGRLNIVSQSTNRANIRPLVQNGDILISDDSGQETRGITIQNGGNLKIGNKLCLNDICLDRWPAPPTQQFQTSASGCYVGATGGCSGVPINHSSCSFPGYADPGGWIHAGHIGGNENSAAQYNQLMRNHSPINRYLNFAIKYNHGTGEACRKLRVSQVKGTSVGTSYQVEFSEGEWKGSIDLMKIGTVNNDSTYLIDLYAGFSWANGIQITFQESDKAFYGVVN